MWFWMTIACSVGGETGLEPPAWRGTQIGDEGGESCARREVAWSDEEAAPAGGLSPAALRARAAASVAGTLSADWQGERALWLEVVTEGPAWSVEEIGGGGCQARWLELDVTVCLRAEDLLAFTAPARLREDPVAWSLAIDADALGGALSPGALPEDAGALTLTADGALEGGWAGSLRWHLERPAGPEEAPAADWWSD